MSNYLDNGAVLPSGLLGENYDSSQDGFNKTYNNNSLRIGVIVSTYPISDESNKSKLTTEYDVLIIEQNEDKGSTPLTYRNCMSAEGLGSVADFFETTLRKQTKKTTKGDSINLSGQNGAVVLVLCLDGMSDKGIIIGSLNHPDRKSTLLDDKPHLEGEYNGINIKVESDGSTTLTFKGATDDDGVLVDKELGNTIMKIEKDGSYQLSHKTITQRFDKTGDSTLITDGNISETSKKNINLTATENIALKSTKNTNVDCADLLIKASGSAMLECQKLVVQAQSEINLKGSQLKIEAESMASIKASTINIQGIVNLGDSGGQPVLLLSSIFLGIGNLGAPVLSQCISGFALKVNAI